MDAEFERRWREGRSPFDGFTVALSDCLPLPIFWQATAAIVEKLHSYRPETSLFRLLDWHEHDGIVRKARPSFWEELHSLLASEQTLTDCFRYGDTYVREGFFPAERDFYFRLYVPDPSDSPYHIFGAPDPIPCGIFDVTCSQVLALELVAALKALRIYTIVIPSRKFFEERYRG